MEFFCLFYANSNITIDGTSATAHINITNNSTYNDALVAFNLDIILPTGLPWASDIDAGQHVIQQGKTVDVFSVISI
ncbi:MAG: hypothetical protein JW841_12790 [Deltaproteobacteria bacterium]|nr:hypothetical protein [Deltaproteobacteria bacterium]